MKMMMRVLLAGLALAAVLAGNAYAHDDGHVAFSISLGGPGYYIQYAEPAYVYYPPVYYAPPAYYVVERPVAVYRHHPGLHLGHYKHKHKYKDYYRYDD